MENWASTDKRSPVTCQQDACKQCRSISDDLIWKISKVIWKDTFYTFSWFQQEIHLVHNLIVLPSFWKIQHILISFRFIHPGVKIISGIHPAWLKIIQPQWKGFQCKGTLLSLPTLQCLPCLKSQVVYFDIVICRIYWPLKCQNCNVHGWKLSPSIHGWKLSNSRARLFSARALYHLGPLCRFCLVSRISSGPAKFSSIYWPLKLQNCDVQLLWMKIVWLRVWKLWLVLAGSAARGYLGGEISHISSCSQQ